MRVLARSFLLLAVLAGAALVPGPTATAQGTPIVPTEAIEPDEPEEVDGVPAVVDGDDQTGGDEAGVEEQPAPPVDTDDPTAIELEDWMALAVVALLLGVAALALWRLFDYLRDSRVDYYRTVREFARKGVFFNPLLVGPTAPGAADARGFTADPATAPTVQTFAVAGPGVIAPGQQAVFNALLNDGPAPGTEWTIEQPAGTGAQAATATLDPSTGNSTTVTASTAGVFVLAATLPGTPTLTVRSFITVTEPPATGEGLPDLPFIGLGFGSIVGAIVLIAALVVLAATRAIDADVAGVVLGALAGYLFGVVAQSRS